MLEPAPPAIAYVSSVISETVSIKVASGWVAGLAVYKPSISDKMISKSASTIPATVADKVSLSPILNSSIATTSFSLIMGITFSCNKVCNVLRKLR